MTSVSSQLRPLWKNITFKNTQTRSWMWSPLASHIISMCYLTDVNRRLQRGRLRSERVAVKAPLYMCTQPLTVGTHKINTSQGDGPPGAWLVLLCGVEWEAYTKLINSPRMHVCTHGASPFNPSSTRTLFIF